MQSHVDGDFRGIGRVIRWGVAGLFLLLAAGIVVAIVLRALYPGAGGDGGFSFAPFYLFPLGFFLLFLFLFGFRWWFRPWGWGWGWGYPYGRYHGGAMEILRERYARGELTKEQFEAMSRDLERTGGNP